MMSLPVWLPGPCSFWRSVSGAMFLVRGLPDRDPPGQRPHDTVKIGQYASYWNAFLFTVVTILLLHQQCSHKWHRFTRLIHIQAVHL